MENVTLEVVEGNRLVIEVDLNHRGDISASGKDQKGGVHRGEHRDKRRQWGGGQKIGLNVYVNPRD